ncbi:MAG: hypothetical protein ACLQF0_01360 [Dissulfurispiraceae bacterium]
MSEKFMSDYNKATGGNVMVARNGLHAAMAELSHVNFKVLMALVLTVGYQGAEVCISHSKVAKQLHVSRKSVINAAKTLASKGLVKQRRDGNDCWYRVSPWLAWQGNFGMQYEAMHKWQTCEPWVKDAEDSAPVSQEAGR